MALIHADHPGTVLVLRALGLGDALTAMPALRGMRRRYPGARLVLAASGPAPRLLLDQGVVDEVVTTRGLDDIPPGLGLGVHAAVNLHGRGPQSHRLLQAGSPVSLLAFASAEAGVRGPSWSETEHEVHRWCRLVDGGSPVCDPADLRLLPDGPRDGPVVVHPGAASGSRRWPAERFAAVVRSLASDGHRVVVTGSGEEATITREVVTLAGLPADADLGGRLGLAELGSRLASASLLVCGDTGVAHLGTAAGTPSVLLFGPTPPRRWGPLVESHRHMVLWHGDEQRVGDPHGTAPDAALLRITEAEVLEAAHGLLPRRH